MNGTDLRVLVVSHGHPSFSLGGAEVASHNLHKGLAALPRVASRYLARVGHPVPRHAASALMTLGVAQDEILYHADEYDHFMLSNANTADIERDFIRYVKDARPDVVHFHHVIGLGLETLFAVREALPNAALVMTFHEYLALCHHHGQMIKKTNNSLCARSSPNDCHQCFPEISPARFLMRERFIRSILDLCDGFVSPSRFLADRYIEWGLPADKLSVIENGLDIGTPVPPRILAEGGRRCRFAFFGQMIESKGADVLIEAAARVPASVWGEDARVMIFGGNLDRASPEYRARIAELETAAGGRVRFYGPYRNVDMPGLMQSVDWVVVPSTWWENSPVVIQEAFFHGRPLIVSNIGGMAEKVRDGIDGLHFRVRSPEDLADRMTEALSDPALWDRLRSGIGPTVSHIASATAHMGLYRNILEQKGRSAGTASGAEAMLFPLEIVQRERRV